jgi:valyl-tRNA synthetase
MLELPQKYNHVESERKWKDRWEAEQCYAWDSSQSRENTFAIDTPPPTVSGSLHIGHVFSYTQTDVIARFQRMLGKTVFYPMGWDDNGLPTERRVQNVFSISCQANLPYQKNWVGSRGQDKKIHEYEQVSRKNFIEACGELTKEDEKVFENIWRKLGLSVDWSLQYATIDDHCRQLSQYSFLDLVQKGKVYQQESPGMWDVDFQTAVAQAEIEDRDCPGAYHHIKFSVEDGSEFVIATTRPELLAACIAVVAHPDDERYKAYFGKKATTPLFYAEVPIVASTHANPEKGTGILMVCTFGDAADVEWWKQSNLPIKQIIARDGTLLPVVFGEAPFYSSNSKKAQENYNDLMGLRIKKSQAKIVDLLKRENSSVNGKESALKGEPEAIMHPVKFYEKGDSPIEFVPSRQWFISLLPFKKELLAQADLINWKPAFMKSRYCSWVEGLNQDWCISRQRYFGVPFPVWYRLDEHKQPRYDAVLYANPGQLPVDPLTDCPEGFFEHQRGEANGFVGDVNVMDTWATSSLTPQIASHWPQNKARYQSVFPMDIRPQSHEIIRTWAFYTIVKAWMHDNSIPWKNVVISGWVLDPDRKKMSKSKGNVVTPEHLIEEFSSDAIRYWAAKARLGADTAFEQQLFVIGNKLVTKLFNASKFVLMQVSDMSDLSLADVTEPLDQSYLVKNAILVEKATKAFHAFDYASALEQIESHFWNFCDHYIELVKMRAYREEDILKRRSACAALQVTLDLFLRLFAPFLPYITEEIWSWSFRKNKSIHLESWPSCDDYKKESVKEEMVDTAILILSDIRSEKSKAQKNMKHPVKKVQVLCQSELRNEIEQCKADIMRAGSVEQFDSLEHDGALQIKVELSDDLT